MIGCHWTLVSAASRCSDTGPWSPGPAPPRAPALIRGKQSRGNHIANMSPVNTTTTLWWWRKGIFKLRDGGAGICKYELLIKIACWERYIQWFLGIICTLCTPAAVSAQYSAGNIVKPHYSRSILTGIQTVHLNSISGQRVDFMFFWINWIRIIAFRENNQID